MKKILVLGAGLVSRPLVKYLLDKGYYLTVADMNTDKIEQVTRKHPNANPVGIDVNNEEQLDELIAQHDLVVSLLPATMHLQVAKFCIKRVKSLITTSYQSLAMLELKPLIEESGITVINEMGLDPGIDHMTARKIIDRVHASKGQIKNFYSLCGALPSPGAADNPMKYKFTWSPVGVMAASLTGARYLSNGHETLINSESLFHSPFIIEYPEIGPIEVYPNRDSIAYIHEYELDEVRSMMRGTIRLPGWCETMDALRKLGLLETQPVSLANLSYFNLIERKVGTLYPEYEKQISGFLKIEENSTAIKALKWLGYFSNESIGKSFDTPFNVTCDLMFSKMMLSPEETDMVIMQHELLIKYPGDREERILSRMLLYGEPGGDTAIARTVALPAAITADLILSGELKVSGLLRPFMPVIYEPVLQKLEEVGIFMNEEVKQLV